MMAKNLLRPFTSSSSSSSSLNPLTKIINYFSIDKNPSPFSGFSTSTAIPTASPTITPSSSSSNSSDSVPKDSLFSRLIPVFNPKDSISQVLHNWVDEGRRVDVDNVRQIVIHLRSHKRYSHALELFEWLDSIRQSELDPGGAAVHLDLIAKVRGLKKAEKYFECLPDKCRGFQTYGALLNCYVKTKSLAKAEEVMQKMRQLGYAKTLCYNNMLTLYSQMGKFEKLVSLVQEMDDQGISFDNSSYDIWLHACVMASDILGMEKVLMKMEGDPLVVMQWNSYAIAANGYLKANDFKKAEVVLKKSERLIERVKAVGRPGTKARIRAEAKSGHAYQVLITLYATMGRKDEVYRLWGLHKKPQKSYNRSYFCVMHSLLKLDDLDGAEKMLDEWLANKVYFDAGIPNLLIIAFFKRGHIERAEAIMRKLMETGDKPNASTWSCMAHGYCKADRMEQAVEMTKKSITANASGWRPDLPVLAACLEYLKKKGDVDGAEEILRLLEERGNFSAEFKERIASYIRKGDPALQELDQGEKESKTLEEDILGDREFNSDIHPDIIESQFSN